MRKHKQREYKAHMQDFDFYGRLIGSADTLRRYAHGLTNNTDTIDDIVQETMYIAIINRDGFKRDENFIGWLSSIMRNTYFNMLNHERRYTDYEFEDTTVNGISCDSNIEYCDLVTLIESIPYELRMPLNLYAAGYKYREITDELGIPLGTVQSRRHLARNILKAKLKR